LPDRRFHKSADRFADLLDEVAEELFELLFIGDLKQFRG